MSYFLWLCVMFRGVPGTVLIKCLCLVYCTVILLQHDIYFLNIYGGHSFHFLVKLVVAREYLSYACLCIMFVCAVYLFVPDIVNAAVTDKTWSLNLFS